MLRLLKLSYESSRTPLRRVRFRADLGETFVTITDENLRRTREEFLNAESSRGATGRTRPRAKKPRRGRASRESVAPGLDAATRQGEDQAVVAAVKLPFPVYYPKYIKRGGRYYDGFSSDAPRTYDLFDEDGTKHRAYRMVIEAPGIGEYYGVQGTDWQNPPITANPSQTTKVDGRELMLFKDGSRLRMVAWKTERATYWVSNTLLRSLTNRQMIGIARSLTRVGAGG